jgi:hypothetical protein
MDKPIPEAARAIRDVLFRVYMDHDDLMVTTALLHDMAVAVSSLTAAQQQGQTAAWMTPESIAHLAKQNGPAKVDAWNCSSGTERVPVYAQPMQQGGGEVFGWWMADCNGVGRFVYGSDPECRQHYETTLGYSARPLYTAPPSAPVGVEDSVLERAIEESDGAWHDDEFRIEGAALMSLLRSIAQQPAAVDELPDCPHSALDGCDCYATQQQEPTT